MDTHVDDRTDHQPATLRTREVCDRIGVSYRVVDYWARKGVLCPSVTSAAGSGSQRLYSREDVRVAAVLVVLTRLGLGTVALGVAATALRLVPRARWDAHDVVLVTAEGEVVDATPDSGAYVVVLPSY